MGIFQQLIHKMRRDEAVVLSYNTTTIADIYEARQPFGRLIWANVTEMVTRLCNDVTFYKKEEQNGQNALLFADFVRFFQEQGEYLMLKMYRDGYVVVGHGVLGFEILDSNDYTRVTDDGKVFLVSREGREIHLLKSPTFDAFGTSDFKLCRPMLEYLDNALNASNTCSARLGALVIASPSSGSQPMTAVLTKEQKKDLEKSISEEYGALRNQKQIMVLPRSMEFQTVNLAGIDQRTQDKVRSAVLAIADRIQVPANQIAMIEGTSGKGLTNGGELQEGDFLRYATFERMLNRSFVTLARECGLAVDYTIYNKPERDNNISSLSTELLGVLSTNEKREALGYQPEESESDTVLAQTLGVGGTQSLIEVLQSETLTDADKRGVLQVVFGLDYEQTVKLVPFKQ